LKEISVALILLADDDEIVVAVISEALDARGHVVHALHDGLSVLREVESTHPELVILDCTMPELGGIEALRQIRTSRTCFATPVLMLTGRRSAADEAIAMRTGANDYLRKPFDPDQLVSWAEILVEQGRARRLTATMQAPLGSGRQAEHGRGQR
jgi:two-component system phosphate regulon response regulator PhoB